MDIILKKCVTFYDSPSGSGHQYQIPIEPWNLSVKTTAHGVSTIFVRRSTKSHLHRHSPSKTYSISARCIMPRGFLVKRFSKTSPPSSLPPTSLPPSSLSPSRVRRYSDEDRSDTSSDHELIPDNSEVLRKVFCGRPPPLCPDKPLPEAGSSSPIFDLGQVSEFVFIIT